MGQSKWAIACVIVIAVAGGYVVAQEAGESTTKIDNSPREAERRIEAIMDDRMRSPIEFIDAPLNTIIGVLAEEYQIPIEFDVPGLEAQALSAETEISVNLRDITLRSALDLMLRNIRDSDYIITDEVLLITSRAEAARHMQVKVYRVDDLVGPEKPNAGGTGADFNALHNAIVSCVEPSAWAENGTGEGKVVYLEPGMLVVTQSQRVHRKIADLLEDLRRVKVAIDRGEPEATASASPRNGDRKAPRPVSEAKPAEANPFDGL